MKPWMIAAIAVLAAPSTALACSCLYTENPEELRTLAREVAPNAVALVEAKTTQTYAESNGAGDRMRIVPSGLRGENSAPRVPWEFT